MRSLTCLFLASVLAAGAMAAPGDTALQKEQRATAALLAADARLHEKVSLACKAQPMDQVVAELRGRLHVPLTATTDTRDEKVTAFLDGREGGEVLRLLAEHLGFQWTRAGQGYRLGQSELAQRAELRALQAEDDAGWAAITDRIRTLAPLMAMPADALAKQRDDVLAKLREPGLSAAERDALRRELGPVMSASFPGAPLAVREFSRLTPAQVQSLRAGRALQSSTLDGSLSPALAQEILAAAGNRLPPQADTQEKQVDLIFYLSRDQGTHGVPEQAMLHPLRLVIAMPVGTRSTWFPLQWSPDPPPPPAVPIAQTATDDPDLKRKVTIAAPKRAGQPQPRLGWKVDLPTVADVAEALHRDAGLEVIADAYIRGRLSTPPGETTAVQALDTVAGRIAYTWKREGGVVRLRSRIAERDRRGEVPARLLDPWTERVKGRAPRLDDLAALAASLTEPQAQGLYEYWGWYLEKTLLNSSELAGTFHSARPDLLLWFTLNQDQRRAALAGEPLLAARLAPPQRAAFFRALTPQPFEPAVRLRFRNLTPADDLSAAALRLRVEQQRLQRLRHTYPGGIAAEIDAPVKPDGTYESLNLGSDVMEKIGEPVRVDLSTFTYVVLPGEGARRRVSIRLPK